MKLRIDLASQELELQDDAGGVLRRYPVSTAANGPGEESGSFCTPRGSHIVRAKIGAGQPADYLLQFTPVRSEVAAADVEGLRP